MDPNANLQRQLQLARNILRSLDVDLEKHPRLTTTAEDDAEELAELVLALDEWLNRGGFKPSRWVVL